MNLTELENTLSVSFPKLFQDIYNSGMLDYLTCPAGENPFDYKDICGNDREYFFYNCTYDCEWLPFAEFANARTELYEWFDFLIDLAQKQEGLHKHINENFTIIPFAHKASGDSYCFLFEKGQKEPKIILHEHDTGDSLLWAENFEEFIYFQFVPAIAEEEEETDSDYTKAHIQWINQEHQKLLSETPIKTLLDALPEPEEFEIFITKI